ncbi:MAG: hypothetical protein ACFE9V_19655 [Candidatus Hodarchaeota archaeon]
MDWFVLLTYFDRKKGPIIFLSYPEQTLKNENCLFIANLMDQINSEEFFSYSFNHYHTLNYYFEINSYWARGNKELLMLSSVFDHQPSFETEKTVFSLCIEFSEWLKLKDGIFAAFYSNDEIPDQNGNENIALNRYYVKMWLKEFYWTIKEEIQDKLEEENITLLLDKNDVLETLDYLSKGPVSLKSLKTWYVKRFHEKNFHKMILDLLKSHMIDIPKIDGKKKPPFLVYISKEIKSIIKLIIAKNKLIKQFLQNNHKFQPFEKETQELHNFLNRVLSKSRISISEK